MYKVSFIGRAFVKAIASSILQFVPLPNFLILLHLLQPNWEKVYVHKNALAKVYMGLLSNQMVNQWLRCIFHDKKVYNTFLLWIWLG